MRAICSSELTKMAKLGLITVKQLFVVTIMLPLRQPRMHVLTTDHSVCSVCTLER